VDERDVHGDAAGAGPGIVVGPLGDDPGEQ
jgi:hypothetical protein